MLKKEMNKVLTLNVDLHAMCILTYLVFLRIYTSQCFDRESTKEICKLVYLIVSN